MTNIKSKIKRIKQSRKAAVRNKDTRSSIKNLSIELDKALNAKDKKKANTLFNQIVKSLDKACAHGVIHANKAASRKSSFSKKINALK